MIYYNSNSCNFEHIFFLCLMDTDPKFEDVIVRQYSPGETIISEGTESRRFFVILKGTIEIFQNNKSIRFLKDGDIFGIEYHYLEKPYSTTAVSITGSRIASYHISMINDIINRPFLARQIFFSLSSQLEQTTQVAQENIPFSKIIDINEKIYGDGDIIIPEGSDGNEIYMLVESERGLSVLKDGREINTINKPGEFFGEISAILKEKRTATIVSKGRSVVQIFSGDNIEEIFENFPHVSKTIIDTIAKRLVETNKKLASKDFS